MFWKRKQDDFSAEIETHLRLEEDQLRDEGVPEEEARAAARRAFGNQSAAEERFYESRRWLWWDRLLQDLRYACRTLSRNVAFTTAAVLTLALGIGANTAIFTVIDSILLRPLPYPDPNRLVKVYGRSPEGDTNVFSAADFLDYQQQGQFFEHLAAFRDWSFNLIGQDRPERVNGVVVTPGFFPALGVQAQVGRTLAPMLDQPGASRNAVLSHGLWQTRYGGAPGIVGRKIHVDGQPVTVVGVMPRGFEFPPGSQLWVLSQFDAPEHPLRPEANPTGNRGSHYIEVIARLRTGVTLTQARAEASTIAQRLKQQYGDDEEATGAALVPLHDDLVENTRPALMILLGAVALLLLIGCVNVANLLLARGAARQKEIAIRAALGAGHMRLARQFLTESLVLAGVGGGVGSVLGHVALKLLEALSPTGMLGGAELHLDARVLAFTAFISLACGILFGLLPALQAAKPHLNAVLKEGARGSAAGVGAHRTRAILVICEIALAAVLLVGAGLLIRSFRRLLATPQGFQPERLLTLQLSLAQARYPKAIDRAGFVRQALESIRALPSVSSAAAISRLPLNPGSSTRSVEVQGRIPPSSEDPAPDYLVVTPHYFRSMGISVLRGRPFTERDGAQPPHVAIVSDAMARHFWAGQDALGKLFRAGACGGEKDWCRVVGVVADVHQHRLDAEVRPAVYVPYEQDPWPFMTFVVRTGVKPKSAASAVEAALRTVDKDQPVYGVRTMEQVVSASVSPERLRTVLLTLFALLALVLACVGIYGVIAYSVAQRTHEIGIRMALGAQAKDVKRLIVGHGLALAAAGIVIGIVLSVGLAQLMAKSLYGVQPADSITVAGVSVLLISTAALASYVPARRASRVDPLIALRSE